MRYSRQIIRWAQRYADEEGIHLDLLPFYEPTEECGVRLITILSERKKKLGWKWARLVDLWAINFEKASRRIT